LSVGYDIDDRQCWLFNSHHLRHRPIAVVLIIPHHRLPRPPMSRQFVSFHVNKEKRRHLSSKQTIFIDCGPNVDKTNSTLPINSAHYCFVATPSDSGRHVYVVSGTAACYQLQCQWTGHKQCCGRLSSFNRSLTDCIHAV